MTVLTTDLTLETHLETRLETDLLGVKQIPAQAYYGIHTLRAMENFKISKEKIGDCPEFVRGMVKTKKAAALANGILGTIPEEISDAIVNACNTLLASDEFYNQFPVDAFQGGAGTSVNMNTNEVIANIALEQMGHAKGAYNHINPNDHVNKSQSTNDAYPTGFRVALFERSTAVLVALTSLSETFLDKAEEFNDVLKMGRTQLQGRCTDDIGSRIPRFWYYAKRRNQKY